MNSVEITITARKNGEPLAGFPFTRRMEVDELQSFSYEKLADNNITSFAALPADQLDTIQLLVVKTDIPITLRLDGQTDAGIMLNAGGMLILVDATIDAGAGASNASVNNPDAALTATVKGIAAGT